MGERPVLLIADDSDDVVLLLKTYLRRLNCDFLVAKDGEEALAIAQSRLPAVVLLDVMMPKRSGWEVCQALKAVQRTSQIAVVLVTGRGDAKDRLTGLQVGADDYLVKPFDRDQVVNRIRRLLERRKPAVTSAEQTTAKAAIENLLLDRATGLPTVPMILDRIKEVLIEQGEIGIVFVDIEQYEAIEAEYGWAFFDEFLRRVAEVVTGETKKRFQNASVAAHRVAGSSFFVFFQTKDVEHALESTANELRETLVNALRLQFPKMSQEQIGFFVGATRVEYRPQIRLE